MGEIFECPVPCIATSGCRFQGSSVDQKNCDVPLHIDGVIYAETNRKFIQIASLQLPAVVLHIQQSLPPTTQNEENCREKCASSHQP